MSDIAIRVENLGKQYRIGSRKGYKTLRESISGIFSSPFRLLRANSQSAACNSQSENIWALEDVSFEIMQGEVIGIIGRNGAGKSTLLKILSRITKPTCGRALLRGSVGSLLEVGTGFHPELTGRENIYLNGAILGMRTAEIIKQFDEIVDFAEVEKFVDTPVKHYSSGMYVRLAFAVAAHLQPEILLVDEVLAVGDLGFQKKCLGKMGNIAQQGRTVLLVSHNMAAVNTLCGRGILLNHGRIEQMGPIAQVSEKYLQTFGSASADQMEQIWPDPTAAPGNEKIRLRRIAVIPEEGGSLIDMTTPFRFELEYWNLCPQIQIIVNLCIYAIEGAAAFETWTVNEPNWHGRFFPRGLFRSTCRIPGNLLNEGRYRIRAVFFDIATATTTKLFDHQDAATITVQYLSEREVAFFGKYIGLVHPKLVWNTQLIKTM